MNEPVLINAEEAQHCLAFLSENADRGIRKNAHRIGATPLNGLSAALSANDIWRDASVRVHARRSVVSFATRRSSFDLWASLGHLENLLSDFRRIEPRFSFLQLAGEAGVATGNEYRLVITDPGYLSPLKDACKRMVPDRGLDMLGDERTMDIRVTRAGPWGGETGELVVEALENHALAGVSSLWLVAHGESSDGNLLVTLDAFEIARWAWAPDYEAHSSSTHATEPVSIVNWRYLFERLIQDLDGTPEPNDDPISFEATFLTSDLADLPADSRVADALCSHSALSPVVERIKNQDASSHDI
jgi:hypothetical protein